MEAERDELRLVLIGQTGGGKSSSGNTILGRKHFLSRVSASPVTRACELGSTVLPKEEGRAKGRRVTVVDLPRFGDTHLSAEQIHTEVARCVCLCAPGPHAFLLTVPIGRYTDQEDQAVRQMTEIFGETALRHHTVLLFTRGDDLEGWGIQEYLSETAPAGLRALIDRCGGRYHVFDNRDPGNSSQVTELLVKVDAMVKEAGFYTNRMFKEAEAEERRLLGKLKRLLKSSHKELLRMETVEAMATGFGVGAVFVLMVPLAAAGIVYLLGNSIVGMSVAGSSQAVALGKTAAAVGAVAGGLLGGTVFGAIGVRGALGAGAALGFVAAGAAAPV